MDLSTLSSLLERHTATLTSLYDELGAPPSTVSSKLEELHGALISTVNAQRESAEQEVAAVKKSVDELRRSCTLKRKQLGEGRTSSTNNNTKETLLQAKERLEKEEKDTDKLVQQRQKQLQAVNARLEAFVDTLGRETVYVDEPPNNDEDLSLTKLSSLEKEVVRCENEVKHREQQLTRLINDIAALWNDLGMSPLEQDSYAVASDLELDRRILGTLDGAVVLPPPQPLPMTSKHDSISALTAREQALQTELVEREAEIQKLYDELYILWTRLGVSDEEADAFVEEWAGTQQRCIDAYRKELERMLQVKADNMIIFIRKERDEIEYLWNELFYSEDERRRFGLFDSDLNTEEVLAEHEAEKQRLIDERETKTQILTRLRKYFELLDEAAQLQASLTDPARLTAKGQRGDPGRLLREEKIRKRVAKEKPKLENDLLSLIPAWEHDNNQPFLVNGTRFVEDLTAKLEMDQAGRGTASKRSKTPVPPTSAAPPLKRQMTGSSTSSTYSNAPSTTKRPRTNTLSSASASASQAANILRPMHTGSSTVSSAMLATPCPPNFSNHQVRSGDLMLVPGSSSSRPAAYAQGGPSGSRLPIKAQTTGFAQHTSHVGQWQQQQLGINSRQQANGSITAQSLFSPQAQAIQQHKSTRASFRPRPSILSTQSSSQLSVASSTSWGGLRTASSATSVDSRDSRC